MATRGREGRCLISARSCAGVATRYGVQCIAYSPLGHIEDTLRAHPVVKAVAERVGKTPAQVLLRWNVQRGVPVIPKTTNAARLEENIQGLFEWALDHKSKAELDALDANHRFVKPEWASFDDPELGGVAKPSVVFGYDHTKKV